MLIINLFYEFSINHVSDAKMSELDAIIAAVSNDVNNNYELPVRDIEKRNHEFTNLKCCIKAREPFKTPIYGVISLSLAFSF